MIHYYLLTNTTLNRFILNSRFSADAVSLSNLLTFIIRQYFLPKSLQYSTNGLSTSSVAIKAHGCSLWQWMPARLRVEDRSWWTLASSVKACPALKKHLRLCTKREVQDRHERTGSFQPPSHRPSPEVAQSAPNPPVNRPPTGDVLASGQSLPPAPRPEGSSRAGRQGEAPDALGG